MKPKPQTDAENRTPTREDLPGGARSMDKKDPPPNVRNAPQSQDASRNTPRSKR